MNLLDRLLERCRELRAGHWRQPFETETISR